MSTSTSQMTADELLRLPNPSGGKRYELVRGALRVYEPAGGRHGEIISTLSGLLFMYLRSHPIGALLSADTGFTLEREPDTVRAPDIGFVSAARIPPEGIGDKFINGAPDLAVEVLSPGDSIAEAEEKVAEYLRTGARMVWMVNPKHRRVTVYRADAPSRALDESERLDGDDVLPGFSCSVRDIFQGTRVSVS